MTWNIKRYYCYILQNKEKCAEKIIIYDRSCPEASHERKLNMICCTLLFLNYYALEKKNDEQLIWILNKFSSLKTYELHRYI